MIDIAVPATRDHASANAGTRGFFGKGDMQKEFEDASFALKPGDISSVVQTASGLHLIERYVRLCQHGNLYEASWLFTIASDLVVPHAVMLCHKKHVPCY